MRDVTKLTDNKFVNIYSIVDPDNHVKGYQYAERRGVDSIAFICVDKFSDYNEKPEYLLNNEYKPPVNAFVLGAFGGSLDKNVNKVEIVIEEVREEAGFEVADKDVISLGRVFVSTQMNQYCYLYLVWVDKKNQLERKPENAIEAMARTKWVKESDIRNLEDWKAITIVARR